MSRFRDEELPDRIRDFLSQYLEHIDRNVLKGTEKVERQRHAEIFHSLAHPLDEETVQEQCNDEEFEQLKFSAGCEVARSTTPRGVVRATFSWRTASVVSCQLSVKQASGKVHGQTMFTAKGVEWVYRYVGVEKFLTLTGPQLVNDAHIQPNTHTHNQPTMIELRIVTNAEDRPQELSSREIADICGKRHSVVMRGIRSTLARVSIDARKFEGIDLDARNREKPCYYLPRLECSLVVSGYSFKRQMALRQRRQEIEERWKRSNTGS